MIIHAEKEHSDFEGTIIDLETVGNFEREFSDSRQYRGITPVIFGYITSSDLLMYAAKSMQTIPRLQEEIKAILSTLPRPLYAFNIAFEKGVLYHFVAEKLDFLELNSKFREKKERVVEELGLDTYDDPFHGDGYACSKAWQAGRVLSAMAHNRACLLKERDILKKRGFRDPDPLELRI
jgi:hypothetical protein